MEALARSGPGAVLVETGEGRFAFGGVIVKVPSHLLLMPLRDFQGYLVIFFRVFSHVFHVLLQPSQINIMPSDRT